MFKAFIVWSLLFRWLSTLVIALPATTPPSLSLSSTDIPLQLSATQSAHLNASQIIAYEIPQTRILIIIYTRNPISGSAMRHTLDTCLTTAHSLLDKHGDVYMFPDPNVFSMPPKEYTGLQIEATSTMVPGLRWTDLITGLNGIRFIMVSRAVYKEAYVEMVDEPTNQKMGLINLRKISSMKPVGRGGPI